VPVRFDTKEMALVRYFQTLNYTLNL